MTITLPAERPGRPADPDLAERRGQMQAGVDAGVWKTQMPPLETTIAGRRCLRFAPEEKPRGFLLGFHGGGFRIGMPEFESLFAEALVKRCDIEVVLPQYRLAPEGPFPAALIDAHEALKALRAEVGDEAIVMVGGDSAGGGIAASLAVLCAAQGGPRIDGLLLLSAWLDVRVTALTYDSNAATDPMFSRESADIAAELYLQGFDPSHPLASPVLAPVEGLPPTLVSVGTGEVLFDDSRLFHEKLVKAGVPSTLSAVDGMDHVAVVQSLSKPGAAETFEDVVHFLEGVLAG